MELLQQQLNYREGSLDFKEFKQNGIHGVAKYPAMMVAPMQEKVLNDILKVEKSIENILDPFHGSGTTLVVGKKLLLETIGIDINPLANLLTDVKLTGIDRSVIKTKNSILEQRLNENYMLHDFRNIKKWFRGDIIEDLSKIKTAISKEEDYITRRYYWLCFSNIIYKYKNSRKSTFKLHVKKEEDIKLIINNVIEDFILEINERFKDLPNYNYNVSHRLITKDVREACSEIKKESIDLICTSPPYGDNATTVTYGQFSILSLLWIDKKDLDIPHPDILTTFSKIDYLSLGGKSNTILEWDILSLNQVLNCVSESKQNKIKSFFQDYFEALIAIIGTLKKKGILMLTLGNRTVDGEIISLDKITQEFLEKYGFALITDVKRNIHNKRMPSRVSNLKGRGSVKSMSQETILVFRKEQ
ncbi:site-specific DNA-methyltransferase (cytosine-N4-specific) [Tissierella praeacuta DSM 18095]|uniref:Site-specific DNA-methyltransferase (Cytosine-N4-specific) n=1 Tax=Tissierella praeacuta DSM 18095 TaxID=1123404 RepID=A0A1M4X8V5_9FIRM|nr:DNA methyltransferase [Tissierella praeacuta]SHE89938.1 site-specific DNA-methyltransferase (cytosine-N4-specific) [Tissierella praeacuta DSM 18095]SUP02527.1 Adenine specific DNA methylase Mod [Tissierella praeacuta]